MWMAVLWNEHFMNFTQLKGGAWSWGGPLLKLIIKFLYLIVFSAIEILDIIRPPPQE